MQGDSRFSKGWGTTDRCCDNIGSRYYGAARDEEEGGGGGGGKRIDDKDDKFISSSSFEEDSDEIDALLSLDDEDDDAVSTGRTPGDDHRCNSPDTACSSSTAGGPSCEMTKRARVKKMVKVLRGIVPGAQEMDTPAFLDEAVKYLKSLKMEVKKLGVQNSDK